MKRVVLVWMVGWMIAGWEAGAAETGKARQREWLAEMLRVLPRSEPWEQWLEKSGELPPDFDSLPSIPYLPDPLRFESGRAVTSGDWYRRRLELLKLFERYVLGTIPPSPGNVRAVDIRSREEVGALIEEVTLGFGPGEQARLEVELIIPRGRGPFPVFITQANHRGWALVAVSRGYVGCVYAGADSKDDTGPWEEIWPGYDWTKLTRRAWAASRCIDYLHSLPFVDRQRIALSGHSRNGKVALIAAAIDQRVSAVISSSSGAGGVCSYRLFSEAQFGEGIEMITRKFPDWLHPRLRFFVGRENKLPVDQAELVACIAPRPCLISSALNDNVESIWAVEQTYYSVRRVYELLQKQGELNLLYRPGAHDTRAEDIERYLDWLDTVFGRGSFPFPDQALFPIYSTWKAGSGEEIDLKEFPTNGMGNLLSGPGGSTIRTAEVWLQKREELRRRVLWGLGQAPPFGEARGGSYGAEPRYRSELLGRSDLPEGVGKRRLNFGNYVAGDLYFPSDGSAGRLPAVVWVHPVSVSNGYVAGYRRGEHPHVAMARLGFAVLAFDQIGNGSRVQEVRHFYGRYPHWSLLGKQVEDTLAGVEALSTEERVDPMRIFLVGYGTGGMVALHAAALDDRIAGVATVAGFTAMRLDTKEKGTGGVARWAGWLPFQPRLGAFLGEEGRIPYDYHEVLAMIAPRPVSVFAPRIDYQSSFGDVKWCVDEAAKAYDLFWSRENLQLFRLEDYNRFSPESQEAVYKRLKVMAGL